MSVPITTGTGAASVAAETVSGISYQQIEVYGGGGASVLSVNPDGSFKASIIGVPTVSFSGSPSISGAVTVIGTPSISGTVNIGTQSGSVVAFQTNPANLQVSVTGTVQIAGGSPTSIATVQRLDQQVIGSTLGIVTNAVIHGLNSAGGGGYVDVKVDPSGALVTTGGGIGSVISLLNSTNASVITVSQASVATVWVGTRITSIVSTVPSSVIVGSSLFGQLPGGTAVLGSVAALQGTNPWIITGSIQGTINAGNSSVQVLNFPTNQSVSGTVNTAQSGTVITSIAGTPNVAITSIATANGGLTLNAPFGSWVQGTADFRGNSGASITTIAAQGANVFTYITGIQIANMGSASVLVTLAGGLGSILGYTIAPAGGGSNIVYPNGLKTGANSAFTASISGVSSVLLSAQGFISGT